MHLGVDARALCENEPTGISRYALNVLRVMVKEYPEVTFSFFVSGARSAAYAETIRRQFPEPNVQIRPVRISNKLLRIGFFFRLCALDRFVPEPDLWFVPGIKTAHFKTTPYTITIHDLSFLHFPDFWSIKGRLWHAAAKPKQLIRRATHVFTVSQFTANDVREQFGVPHKDISVVYPGLQMRKTETPVRNRFQILMVSAIEPRKNMEAAIRALARLRTKNEFSALTLTIVGPRGWKTKRLVAAMEQLPWVNPKGYVRDEELATLYASSAVFLYPSFFEGFGFPPLEAMAHGVPVIAGNASSLPEVLGNAALFVNPYDWYELTETLEALLKDASLQQELITRGKARAARYSWAACAAQTMNVLNTVYEHRH